MATRQLLWATILFPAACGGDDLSAPGGVGECRSVELPLSGSSNAPLITEGALELRQRGGVFVLATVTDPQGSDNLSDVPQIIKVFQDSECRQSPIVVQNDVSGSGMEESFGNAVSRSSPLFDAIAGAELWPVELDFRDIDGNRTSGRVLASVMQP